MLDALNLSSSQEMKDLMSNLDEDMICETDDEHYKKLCENINFEEDIDEFSPKKKKQEPILIPFMSNEKKSPQKNKIEEEILPNMVNKYNLK